TYVVFLCSLGLSFVVYRLSPFHPLAQFPGPTIGKITQLWTFWKTLQGYNYLYHKSHAISGPPLGAAELVLFLFHFNRGNPCLY
ncbi:hypothetical protein R3P38DRAFT_2517106, partial [Favolaschia claudopus]